MLDILKFVLHDFWVFIGFSILLALVSNGVVNTITAIVDSFKRK